jgi:hypothetical protein
MTKAPPGRLMTLTQVYISDVSAAAVQRRVRAGEWQIVLPDVLLTRSGPLTFRERCEAVLLWAGAEAALCGPTAATWDGLKGHGSTKIHVAVPGWSGLRSRDFVVVRRSRLLGPSHVHPRKRPRRVRIQRAVVDLAVEARSVDTAIALVAAAIQQRLTRASDIRAVLDDFPRACWRAEILDALSDLEGGSHSLPELQAYRALVAAGLPPPSRQAVRMEGGRRRYLDLFWDELGLCIEIDGAFHISLDQWWADIQRDTELTLDGVRVLHVPAFVVRHRPDLFVDLVRRGLGLAAA